MLGSCGEKMVVTSQTETTNGWPQSHEIDDHKLVSMASSCGSGNRVMEKPGQELLQQQQQALKCPRCDSSNTKFCYYNNYSLSQPRHFCKACKRYWTRGGTLRNVPVGGGCRKNKRVKRPNSSCSNSIDAAASNSSPNSSSAPPASANSSSQVPQIDIAASTSNHMNPLFYGLPGHQVNVNLPFPRFNSLQPHLNALGLGFEASGTGDHHHNGYNRNGLITTSNNTFLSSNYNSIFGSNLSTTTSPVMASLLSSTLMQQKFLNGNGGSTVKEGPGSNNTFQGLELAPVLDHQHQQQMQMASNSSSSEAEEMVALKEVKVEGVQNRSMEWNNNNNSNHSNGAIAIANCQNQIMEHVGFSDPSSLYWNTATAMGATAWNIDQSNIAPNSLTSLI